MEGGHSLWKGVSKPYRETIRAFLAYFQNEVCCSACRIILSVAVVIGKGTLYTQSDILLVYILLLPIY